MSEDIFEVKFTINEREFAFPMTFDQKSPADLDMAYWCRQAGACEPELIALMERVLRPGDLAVDCGANVGFFTVILSGLVGAEGKVLAFEPDAYNQHKIKANLSLNGCKNVELIKQPLWSSVAPVTLFTADHRGHNSLAGTEEATGAVEMQATTLASHLKRVPRLIKIDCEGSEEHILRGAGKLECPYITAEMNEPCLQRLGSSQSSLRGLMREQGYETFVLAATRRGAFFPFYIAPEVTINSAFANLNLLFSTWPAVIEAWPGLIL